LCQIAQDQTQDALQARHRTDISKCVRTVARTSVGRSYQAHPAPGRRRTSVKIMRLGSVGRKVILANRLAAPSGCCAPSLSSHARRLRLVKGVADMLWNGVVQLSVSCIATNTASPLARSKGHLPRMAHWLPARAGPGDFDYSILT
jgi:hypothetical protein